MATTTSRDGIRQLCRAAAPGADSVPDGRLLSRFVAERDQAAFELLVWRHGAMVLRTCRRVLRDSHEADDAVQACFLALARRASAISRRESVGGWLHRVAFRLALRARGQQAKREARERTLDALTPPADHQDPAAEAGWREVRRIVDAEVDRLPDQYRVPFVLCCLEGRSNADAARDLGCAVGTVESRLSRARRRLETALSRRGVTLTATVLATLAARNASAFVPAALAASTAKAATLVIAGSAAAAVVSPKVAAMAEGALLAMWMTKFKAVAGVVLVVVVAGTGTGVLFNGPAVADSPGKAPDAPPAAAPAADEAKRIAGLVARLGSAAFADREKAAKELDAIGAPALTALREAAKGDEAERKKRAEELVKRIEGRLAAAKLLAAKRVRLEYKETPLVEAVADFKAKCGYDIVLSDPEGRLKDRKVTLSTGDVTFWQALGRFCQAANVVEAPAGAGAAQQVAGGGGGGAAAGRGGAPGAAGARRMVGPSAAPFTTTGRITLIDGKPSTRAADDTTAVRVRVAEPGDGPGVAADGEIAFGLEVALEPRLRWQRAVGVEVTKATDSRGQSLEVVRGSDAMPAAPGGFGQVARGIGGGVGMANPAAPGRTVHVRLKKNAKPSTALKELTGTIAIQMLAEPEPYLTVDEILGAAGKTVKAADGGAVRVIAVSKEAAGGIKLRLAIDPAAGGPGGGLFHLTVRSGRAVLATGQGDTAEHELGLVDDKGERLILASAGVQVAAAGAEYTLVFQPAAGQGGPSKLVYSVSRSVTVDVPFTLKDATLP